MDSGRRVRHFLCRSIQLYTSAVNVTTLAFAMKRNPFNHFLFYGGLFMSLGLIVKAAGRYAAFIFAMTAPCRCWQTWKLLVKVGQTCNKSGGKKKKKNQFIFQIINQCHHKKGTTTKRRQFCFIGSSCGVTSCDFQNFKPSYMIIPHNYSSALASNFEVCFQSVFTSKTQCRLSSCPQKPFCSDLADMKPLGHASLPFTASSSQYFQFYYSRGTKKELSK